MASTTIDPESITTVAKSKRQGIALCLSGGGYRAALFHLGATRRLHELGILPQVRSISSVSGGSILAAFLATQMVKYGLVDGLRFQDWDQQVARPFRAFVQNDLRTLPVLLHSPWNWLLPQARVRHLEWLYRQHLTDLTLGDLPARPNFIFCATDLTFGVSWIFERARAGDYQAGYLKNATHWPLARAVAASSCFPPIFGPLLVGARASDFRKGNYCKPDREQLLARLSLSDGGVYDNLGQQPVIDVHEYVFVSLAIGG